MVRQCLGRNRTGDPCSAYVPEGESWCRWHDPSRAAEREEWRKRGGSNRSSRARARRQLASAVMAIEEIDAFLCASLVKVAGGRMEPSVGSAVATIAKTIVGIRTAGELEKRLEELERTAGIGTMRRIG